MDRIKSKTCGLLSPAFADVLIGSQASEGLEAFGVIVGSDEIEKMSTQLGVVVVVVSLDGSFFDGSIHALDLPIGPGMVGFSQTMFDAETKARAIKRMSAQLGRRTSAILGQIGELNSVVSKYGMDTIRHGREQRSQERDGSYHVGALDQIDEGELRGAVDGHQ